MLLMIAAIVTPNLIFVYSCSMNMNLDENIGVTYISFGIH